MHTSTVDFVNMFHLFSIKALLQPANIQAFDEIPA